MFGKRPQASTSQVPSESSSSHNEKPTTPHRRRRRNIIIIISTMVALAIIALAVGLGVGLTTHKRDSVKDDKCSNEPPVIGDTSLSNCVNNDLAQPALDSSFQIILLSPIDMSKYPSGPDPNVDVWDLDMVDNPKSTFDTLHEHNKTVICYFSAGTSEQVRADYDRFRCEDEGYELPDWPGEFWLNVSSPNVRSIMADRIKMAAEKGCDAIDPDNVDGYQNDNGLGLTIDQTADYIQFLHDQAKCHGMSMGLKNALDIIPQVQNLVAFAVNEQCYSENECGRYSDFIATGKPVFHIEYPKGTETQAGVAQTDIEKICKDTSDGSGFNTVLKPMDLNGWVEYCNGTIANTATKEKDN